ncbi:MAG TPA: IPT/TIG domain-containing protein [Myxococcota bacterium]|nr:IPT/TIG domain-containing protein [Myxococcota bacterium]
MFLLLACVNLEVAPRPEDVVPPFALQSLSPTHGPEAGGTAVSIRGEAFTAETTVDFGGHSCQSLERLSARELLCVTPPGEGNAPVVVTDPAGQGSLDWVYDPADSPVDSDDSSPPSSLHCSFNVASLPMVPEGQGQPVELRVQLGGRTDGDGAGAGISGELGLREPGNSASTTWIAATYDRSEGADDIYRALAQPERWGSWELVARFSADGAEAVDCGVLPLESTRALDYCHIQYPCTATGSVGVAGPTVYVWAYAAGVTPGVGAGEGVRVQVALEERAYAEAFATDPTIWPWYQDLSWSADKDGLVSGDLSNDEYSGLLEACSSPGDYRYAARASADDGRSWIYCDSGGATCGGQGSDDGFSVLETGLLTVE